MIRVFRRAANASVVDRMYSTTVEASRCPVLFRYFAIPDTFDGRFESLTFHSVLVLRRLQADSAPGPEIAQLFVDTIFKHFDRALREMGVGDTTVPKRMKGLAEAFLGRSAAYDSALRSGQETLAATLARNVYSGTRDAADLARYVAASAAALDVTSLQFLIDEDLPFVDPAVFATET